MTPAAGTSLSKAEKQAIRERAAELKSSKKKDQLEKEVLAKVAQMREDEQVIARRIHDIVTEVAPELTAKTWYGQPAYANADGQVVVFFQAASKYDQRYSTLGFNDAARLDDGTMWPTSYAVTGLSSADEKKIAALVRRAAGQT